MTSAFYRKKRVLLLIETSRSFGRQIIQGIMRFVTERRHWQLIFRDCSNHDHFPEWLTHWDGDGVIARTGEPKMFRQLQKLKIPIVELLGDRRYHPPFVMSDEIYNCRMVADHFWEHGIRHFGFFSMGHNWWSLERQKAFEQALVSYGMKCFTAPQTAIKNDIPMSLPWWKGCEDEVFDWLRSLPKPIGIFCPWDMHAFFLMNICESRGVAIPEDIAVVGYGDNADLCRGSSPPLSSVAPNGKDIGYQAAVLLNMMIEGITLPKLPIYIPATHVAIRQSSDTLSVSDPDVAAAIHFIRKHIELQQVNVTDVAQHLNISKNTLVRRFHVHLGNSPSDEIMRARMQLAKELLRETQFSIRQIARRLGYAGQTNFIRAFRRHTGLTPGEYRRQWG